MMINPNYVGETERFAYHRNKKATDRLLTLLVAAHADITPRTEPPPAPPKKPAPLFWRAGSHVENVQRAVAAAFPGVGLRDIKSAQQTARIVKARQVSMYLAKTMTGRSLKEIGRRTGGRDHTTVLHAVQKIGRLIQTDSVLAEQVEKIRATIKEMSA